MGHEDNGGALPLPRDLVPVQDVVAHLYQTRGLGWAAALEEIGADAALRLFYSSLEHGRKEVQATAEYEAPRTGRRMINRGLWGGGAPAPARQVLGHGPRGLLALMAVDTGGTDWSCVTMLRAVALSRFGFGCADAGTADAPGVAPVLSLVRTTPTPTKKPNDKWTDKDLRELLQQYTQLTSSGMKAEAAKQQLAESWGYKSTSISAFLTKARALPAEANVKTHRASSGRG